MANDLAAPLPDRTDPTHAGFWEGTDRGELRVKFCTTCRRHHWPPRLGCPWCGAETLDWVAVEPRGTLYSWTVIHRSLTPGFGGRIPYVVVLVELSGAPGVRMIGNVVDVPLEELKPGIELTGVFTPSEDGSVTLVDWKPAN